MSTRPAVASWRPPHKRVAIWGNRIDPLLPPPDPPGTLTPAGTGWSPAASRSRHLLSSPPQRAGRYWSFAEGSVEADKLWRLPSTEATPGWSGLQDGGVAPSQGRFAPPHSLLCQFPAPPLMRPGCRTSSAPRCRVRRPRRSAPRSRPEAEVDGQAGSSGALESGSAPYWATTALTTRPCWQSHSSCQNSSCGQRLIWWIHAMLERKAWR